MIRSVALIGAGAMGAPMARRLPGAQFSLTVCDRNQKVLSSFAQAGATITSLPSDCGGADMIVIVVATDDQLRDVVSGVNGIRAGLIPGRRPVLGVMSTVSHDAVLAISELLGPAGVRVLDAPISGGAVRAAHGELTIMLGGDAADIETATPVFEAMGNRLFHCGGLGAGTTMKIINNILGVANAVMAAEAYELARQHGLSLSDTARVLEVSTGRNFLSAKPEGVPAVYAAMSSDRAAFDSMLSIMCKDIALAVGLTAGSQKNYPGISGLMSIVESLGDETFATWGDLRDMS